MVPVDIHLAIIYWSRIIRLADIWSTYICLIQCLVKCMSTKCQSAKWLYTKRCGTIVLWCWPNACWTKVKEANLILKIGKVYLIPEKTFKANFQIFEITVFY
jgi:hypothetical protein